MALEWPAVRQLGDMVDSVYCETCAEWIPIYRLATAAELIGITPEPLPDECPF